MNAKTRLFSAALAAAIYAAAQTPAAPDTAASALADNIKSAVAAAAAAKDAGAEENATSFTYEERRLLGALAGDVKAALAKAGLPSTTPVSTLPVKGDRDHRFFEGLLKIAVTQAGLNYVEGRTDPMWDEIVSEIDWDNLKDDLLDQETLTSFGRLQAVRILVYGSLVVDADKKGRPRAELVLHATSTETKQHLWGEMFARPQPKHPYGCDCDGCKIPERSVYFQEPVASLLVAGVKAFADTDLDRTLAGRLVPIAEDALVNAGFKVADAEAPDVLVRIENSMVAKDRTADFVAFRGRVPVSAVLPGLANKSLGNGQIEKTGDFIQDDDPAVSSLVSKIDQPLRDWIAQHVTVEACGLRVESVTVSYRDYEPDETSARITQFCDAAANLDGVVSCTLAQRLATGNQAVYRIVSRAGAFPNGFVHALIAENPGLELLPELAK